MSWLDGSSAMPSSPPAWPARAQHAEPFFEGEEQEEEDFEDLEAEEEERMMMMQEGQKQKRREFGTKKCSPKVEEKGDGREQQ